jgi:hypothetical protein
VVQVRLIFATHRRLGDEVRDAGFREDLYQRIGQRLQRDACHRRPRRHAVEHRARGRREVLCQHGGHERAQPLRLWV